MLREQVIRALRAHPDTIDGLCRRIRLWFWRRERIDRALAALERDGVVHHVGLDLLCDKCVKCTRCPAHPVRTYYKLTGR